MLAAENIFTRRRFHEITTDDIASAAQVGKGTIYRYFRDKDDLFFQTASSGFAQLGQLLESAATTDSFEDQLLTACQQVRAFFQRRRRLFHMMQAEHNRLVWAKGKIRDRWIEKQQMLVAAMAAALANGVTEGKVRYDVLANFLLGMLRTQFRDLAEREGRRACDLVVDLFIHGSRCRHRRGSKANRHTVRSVAGKTIDRIATMIRSV